MRYTAPMQAFISRYYQTIFTAMMVVLLGLSFYTGFLEGKTSTSQPVTLSCNQNILSKLSIPLNKLAQSSTVDASNGPALAESKTGEYVGSKNGTKYYSSTSCAGASHIKPENYIWFSSAEDAQIQGFTPGAC